MIDLSGKRIYAAAEPIDMRGGIRLLSAYVEELGKHVMSGDCFLFVNRACTMVKVLTADETGWVLVQKRLVAGKFAPVWEKAKNRKTITLTEEELLHFMHGGQVIQLNEVRKRSRKAA